MEDSVVLYHIVYGARDSTTGQRRHGYTILSASMIIYPPGSQFSVKGHSFYSGRSTKGVTKTEVHKGDIVLSPDGTYYQIVGVLPHTWGSDWKFTVVDLKEKTNVDVRIPTVGIPSSDPKFFGFEDSGPTQKFEDGFERGYFV